MVGRVIAKGLAGDEMSEPVFLRHRRGGWAGPSYRVGDPSGVDEVRRDMIVEAAPSVAGARSADRNIAINAEEDDGIDRPSRHLACIKNSFERESKDPESFVRFHVRRLEALCRAGHVERVDEEHWRVPDDIVERGRAYDRTQGGDRLQLRTLSTIDLERQIASDGPTWLDRS